MNTTDDIWVIDDDEVSLARYRVVLERHGLDGLVSCQDSREVLPGLRRTASRDEGNAARP